MPRRRSGASSSSSSNISDRADEIIGLVLIAFAVFLALSLWTFHPSDPSWSDRVSSDWTVRNYGGTAGAYVAGASVHLLGTFAVLLPVGLIVWGVATFAGIRPWRPGWRELGGFCILLSAAGIFYKTFSYDPLFGKSVLAGGILGYGTAVLLETYLGWAGSWVVLLTVFLSVLIATTGLSIGRFLTFLVRKPLEVVPLLSGGLGRIAAALMRGAFSSLGRMVSGWRLHLPSLAGLRPRLALAGASVEKRAGENNGAVVDHDPAPSGEEAGVLAGGAAAEPVLFESLPRARRTGARPARREILNGEGTSEADGPALFGNGNGRKAGPFVSLPGPAAAEEERGGSPAREPRAWFREEEGRSDASVETNEAAGEEQVLFRRRERPSSGGGIRVGGRRSQSEPQSRGGGGVEGEALEPLVSSSEEESRNGASAALRREDDENEIRVRHAGAPGEPEIVKIEDDSIVPEESPGRAGASPRRVKARRGYVLPSLDIYADPPSGGVIVDEEAIREKSRLLEKTLQEFGVEGVVSEVKTGPVITIYEFAPAPGVKVAKIASLSDDLARALSALSVRIVAPIPGKSVVGIEVPNLKRNAVYAKDILSSGDFTKAEDKLTIGMGKDILGRTALTDLGKIPHLLIAGTTGSGKSVALNMMICSLLMRCMPREVRFLMIDPKMLELSIYEGIPHLLVPVVTDPKKASSALRGVLAEMERRYRRMSEVGVRSIQSYNEMVAEELGPKETERRLHEPLSEEDKSRSDDAMDFMPYIVVVIDELADLMMVSSRDVEESMTRLAQMARAAGIHLLVATQRPSVDVLTGLIKANFPSRIALRVATRTDSRTILDANGAERLLGKGDMLFVPPGSSVPVRIHGAYVSEKEIHRLVAHWSSQGPAVFTEDLFVEKETPSADGPLEEDEYDERYDDAVALVARAREASISLIQRHLRIGYNRAARMIERMEQEGIIGPADGVKRRQVLISEIPGDDAG